MTPSQAVAVVETFAILKKLGANPAKLELYVIPDVPQRLLTYTKPVHGGYPGSAS